MGKGIMLYKFKFGLLGHSGIVKFFPQEPRFYNKTIVYGILQSNLYNHTIVKHFKKIKQCKEGDDIWWINGKQWIKA